MGNRWAGIEIGIRSELVRHRLFRDGTVRLRYRHMGGWVVGWRRRGRLGALWIFVRVIFVAHMHVFA